MRSLKAGAVVLSLWTGLNLLLALGILVSMALGRHPPSMPMVLDAAQMGALDPRAIQLVHSLAVLANGCIAALCGVVLALIWKGIMKHEPWTFWALASSLGFVQLCGFLSDARIGHENVAANVASSLILLAGLALTAAGSARHSPAQPNRRDARSDLG